MGTAAAATFGFFIGCLLGSLMMAFFCYVRRHEEEER